jgi:ribose transport system permease protein
MTTAPVQSAESVPQAETANRAAPAARVLRRIARVGPVVTVLVLLYVLCGLKNPMFFQPTVAMGLVKRAAPLMVLAAGQSLVVIAGGLDLSVGALVTVTVVLAAGLSDGDPGATWWLIPALLLLGIVVGVVNGLVVSRLKVPSFIATLGMMGLLTGAVFQWSGGAPRGALAQNFRVFGRSWIDVPVLGQLPYSVIVVVAVTVLGWWLLHRSDTGQRIFAVGGNANTAELSGVAVSRVRILVFALSALSAVVAGILLGGFAGVSANVGSGMEFEAISAVVVGGAVIGGGRGSLPLAVAGALTLEMLFTLLNLFSFPEPIRDTVQGVIIIGAVAYGGFRARRTG